MKEIIRILFSLFLIIILFFSCSSKPRHHSNDSDTSFVKGKVTEVIKCRYDVAQSYALYLPSDYDKNIKWPVIYFFDPHGEGAFPLNKYDSIAEEFGYILIGSNNSKNGVQMNSIKTLFDTLYSDTHRKFSIDDNQIYAAGFSGGSRVASSLAANGKIKSVIACGAGMSGADANAINKFGYFGIVGNTDFNYSEMMAVKEYLDESSSPHCFIVFDGKHAWPSDSIMQQAFLWIDLQAMKSKTIEQDLGMAVPFYNSWTEEFEKVKSTDPYQAYLLCEKIISYFDGIKDIASYKTSFEELKKNSNVLATIEMQKVISQKESDLQTEYMTAIGEKDTIWWKQQIAQFNTQINSSAEKSTSQMYKRVLNYLSLAAYSNANSAIKSGNFASAEKYVKIYSLVDPENAEHAFMQAILLLKKNKIQEALKCLEEAASLGFAEPDRLESDTVMDRLRSDDKYQKILESVKINATKEQ